MKDRTFQTCDRAARAFLSDAIFEVILEEILGLGDRDRSKYNLRTGLLWESFDRPFQPFPEK